MERSKKYYLSKEQEGGKYIFRVLPEAPTPNIRFTPIVPEEPIPLIGKYGAPLGVRFLPVNYRPDELVYVRVNSNPFRYNVQTPANQVRNIMRQLRFSEIDQKRSLNNNNLRSFTIEVPNGKFEVYMTWQDVQEFINKIENTYGSNNKVTIIREFGNGAPMSADEAMTELKKLYN